MDTTATHKEKTKVSDLLVDFIQKRKLILLGVLIAFFVILAVVGLVLTLRETSQIKAISRVETLSERYDEIRTISDETKKKESIVSLLEELKSASNKKDFPSARALSIIASIHVDLKEWTEAENAWIASAEAAPKSYLAPVALYNAATVAEDRGDPTSALTLYTRCVQEYNNDYPLTARAYFSIGRLSEQANDAKSATDAYKKIVDTWPNEGWTKMANSRILSITLHTSNP